MSGQRKSKADSRAEREEEEANPGAAAELVVKARRSKVLKSSPIILIEGEVPIQAASS